MGENSTRYFEYSGVSRNLTKKILTLLVTGAIGFGLGAYSGYSSGRDKGTDIGRREAIESLDMAQYDLHQFRRMDTSRTAEKDMEYAKEIISMTRARDFLKENFGLDDIVEKK